MILPCIKQILSIIDYTSAYSSHNKFYTELLIPFYKQFLFIKHYWYPILDYHILNKI